MDKLTRNPAPQVCLRPFVPADRAAMLELLTDAAVAKTYMLPVFSAREEAVPLFERLLALSQDAARFVRCIEKDGAPVGILNDVEMTGETVELGWAVLPAHWGQGCATAALAAAVPQLFARGFSAVRAGAFCENAASLRVMEKCGMTRIDLTEDIVYRGKTYRCVYCELTRP